MLQALHASAPLIAIWDDHEFANNAFKGGSEQHNGVYGNLTVDGPWSVRVEAAARAYHEWIPTRYFMDDGKYLKIWRSFTFGDLATLMMLETRVVARTDSNRNLDTPYPHPPIFDAFGTVGKMGFGSVPPAYWTPSMIANIQGLAAQYDAYRNQSNLTVTGNEQIQWLTKAVKSAAQSTTWQLLGQDTVMLEQFPPDFQAAIAAETDPNMKAKFQSWYTNLTGPATTVFHGQIDLPDNL